MMCSGIDRRDISFHRTKKNILHADCYRYEVTLLLSICGNAFAKVPPRGPQPLRFAVLASSLAGRTHSDLEGMGKKLLDDVFPYFNLAELFLRCIERSPSGRIFGR